MAELGLADVVLHFEVEGSGDPVTVFAHGLTNSCMELAAFTPMAPGTRVRFCFRGHGHSGTPAAGAYAYADFARDLDAVARETGATAAVGTSLGAGRPRPAARRANPTGSSVWCSCCLPRSIARSGSARCSSGPPTCSRRCPATEAIDAILRESGRARSYDRSPGLREFDLLLWQDMNPVGVARAIRQVVLDPAVADLGSLRAGSSAGAGDREGGRLDPPSPVARRLAEVLPERAGDRARVRRRSARLDPDARGPGEPLPGGRRRERGRAEPPGGRPAGRAEPARRCRSRWRCSSPAW